METLSFFSRQDSESLGHLFQIFEGKPDMVWLIETTSLPRAWVSEDNDHVYLPGADHTPTNPSGKFIIYNGAKMYCKYDTTRLTTDKKNAKRFKTQLNAIEYCIVNKLGTEFTQTEHDIRSF